MSDIEAGGALATAALVAKALEPEGASPGESSHTACANCGAETKGAFCYRCGQKTHVHRSLLHLGEELIHGVLHLDSKLWRTLPMLFVRPGLLTRRFVEGQRARYISPLPLFLFSIFLMFFVLSYTVGGGVNFNSKGSPEDVAEARAELQSELRKAEEAVAAQQAKLGAATDPEKRAEAEEELADAQMELQVIQKTLEKFNTALQIESQIKDAAQGEKDPAAGDQAAKAAVEQLGIKSPVLEKSLKNPELMKYKLKNTAYKFSFLLIPLSLPFLWLLFAGRRDVHMYDHAIFATYSLSFVALFLALFALLQFIPWLHGRIEWLLWAVPLHMFWQLREAYKIGYLAAAWRTVALLFCAFIGFIGFIILVAAISAQ